MPNVLDRLAKLLPDLPPKMASAARFALDHPDFIALNSMRSSAANCGVTSPTMLRLARLMNFKNYGDFKTAFQESVVNEGFGDRAKKLTTNKVSSDQQSVLQALTHAAMENMENTLSQNDPDVLRQMAKVLLSARTPYILGLGSMHPIAMFMQVTGRITLPGLQVPRFGEATMVETLGAIGKKDTVLSLSVSPYAKETVEALKFSQKRGARIMVITDRRSSPMLKYADLHLLTPTSSPHYYPSFVGVVAVVEALLASVVAEGGDSILDRIAEIERLRERSGAYFK
jgi:DNA-binding MurR/RpiR family transcriptional regulator